MSKIERVARIGGFEKKGWSIEGVVSGLTLLWGGPGAGKTFTTISMAVSVATGRPWMGRRTKAGPVVYIAGEGGSINTAYRVRTALAEWAIEIDDPRDAVNVEEFNIVTPGIDLVENVNEFAELVGIDSKVQLVVVDTLSRCFSGDENKQEYMAKFVQNLDLIRDNYNCDIVIIHHANKSKTLRGSSVLDGAVDVSWHLTRGSGKPPEDGSIPLLMKADKLRERDAAEATIRMRAVPKPIVGQYNRSVINEFGKNLSTLVIKPAEADLARVKTLVAIGERMLPAKKSLTYDTWRKQRQVEKYSDTDFDAALSFILTQPGRWGIMQDGLGVFVKAGEYPPEYEDE